MIEPPSAASLEEGYRNASTSHGADADASLEFMNEYKERSEPIRHQEVCEVILSSSHGPLFTQAEQQEAVVVCRVCQCADPDKIGEAALKSLGICFPSHAGFLRTSGQVHHSSGGKDKVVVDITQDGQSSVPTPGCKINLESGTCTSSFDSLIELGCACRSDLALAHYACALRWFVSRDSIVCEICGTPALNVRIVDRDKVISTLKERYSHHRSTFSTEASSHNCTTNLHAAFPTSTSGGVALEAVSWFDPHGNIISDYSRNASEPIVDIPEEGLLNSVSPATKWAVEGTGILIATGLLTVTITWLLAPRVNKGVAKKGLNVLLGGLCALAIVVFLRFGVLPRIKYGPARYWAILVVFWFLIFGVWASSSRSAPVNN